LRSAVLKKKRCAAHEQRASFSREVSFLGGVAPRVPAARLPRLPTPRSRQGAKSHLETRGKRSQHGCPATFSSSQVSLGQPTPPARRI